MGILRFLLAISVVIAHSTAIFGVQLVGGEVAVQTFYIISGFYMGLILTEKYVGKNSSYTLFITNRLLRLYPIYWTVFLLSVLLSLVAYVKGGPEGSGKITAFANLLHDGGVKGIFIFLWAGFSNIFLFFQDWFVFLGLDTAHNIYFVKDFHHAPLPLFSFVFLPQAWTVGVEITFYLIAPFLAKRNTRSLFILLACSIFIRVGLYFTGCYKDPWSYRFFPSECAFFIIGILAYRFFKWQKANAELRFGFVRKYALYIMLIATVSYQWLSVFAITRFLYPLLIAVLIPFLFEKFSRSKWDNWIGDLSYPIYISHITLYIILQKGLKTHSIYNGILLVIISVVAAILLNRFVSKPIEKYRQRRVTN